MQRGIHISRQILLLICGISIIFNILTLVFIFSKTPQKSSPNLQLRSIFPLLSPRVFLENPNDRLINFVKLRQDLSDYYKKSGAHIGFYFEYLPSGVSIGVNDKEDFILASLLKTPLAMGVYKNIDEGKIHKTDILEVKKEHLDNAFGDLWKKGPGINLSLMEAIKYTLILSDNTAKNVLFSAVPEGTLEDVYDSLDIPKDATGGDLVVTPKNYSSILRSLYLSSYLSEESSNEILTLLTETPFNDKLVAGVPKTVKVAHKIGVHKGDIPGQEIFTDCGIVYVPKRPYILCIMSKENEPTSRKVMKDISSIVYSYVSSTNL